jgi:hypothetical protein
VESSIKGSRVETFIKGHLVESSIKGSKVELSKGHLVASSFKGSKVALSVKACTVESSAKLGLVELSVKGCMVEPSVKLGLVESSVKLWWKPSVHKNAHILAKLQSDAHWMGNLIKRDSAFVIPSSITSSTSVHSENDAHAFLDLYTNLMKNTRPFFVQILDFCAKQKGPLTLFHEHCTARASISCLSLLIW